MSKSLGNAVDPEMLRETYGADNVRYYLLRHIAVTQDSPFSTADLQQAINSELANDLGNLLNRVVTLAHKNNLDRVEAPELWSEEAIELRDQCWDMLEDVEEYMNDCLFHMALGDVWKFIRQLNAYVHQQEPWKIVKSDTKKFAEIISAACHGLRVVGYILWPVMPEKMTELLNALGIDPVFENHVLQDLQDDRWAHTFTLQAAQPLFKRIDIKEAEVTVEEQNYITIDDLVKVELRVGTIKHAEILEKSDKLYALQVDLGEAEPRQILAGVRKHFSPEQLVDKQAVFVTNLQPRKMLGFESQGMMLVAEDDQGNLQLTTVGNPVPNGTRLR
jgi:methionyl-tRNA synthetase